MPLFKEEHRVLTRDQILDVKDITIERVPVPEWGGDVFVKGLSGHGRDEFEKDIFDENGEVNIINMRAKLVALTICDENGNLLFSTSDIIALSNKSYKPLERVFRIAQRLSGLGKESKQELADGLKNA